MRNEMTKKGLKKTEGTDSSSGFLLDLFDRIEIIKQVVKKYGEENFYISFSGGKDSTVLHYLVDMALPNNRIPRVYIDTGMEYKMVRDFVFGLAEKDDRFHIIKPSVAIKPMLEKEGYPFKSKEHSHKLDQYKRGLHSKSNIEYRDGVRIDENGNEVKPYLVCPSKLRYQFTDDFKLKVGDRCCYNLKKKPIKKWEKKNNRFIAMTGMRREEGGQRASIKGCVLTDKKGNLKKFHPLLVVSEEWEDWFVKENNIQLAELYYPPFNFKRTGCKGCPFSLDLQEQLTLMELYLPNERKQCEIIWKPVYDEYRRIGFRLDKDEQLRLI